MLCVREVNIICADETVGAKRGAVGYVAGETDVRIIQRDVDVAGKSGVANIEIM